MKLDRRLIKEQAKQLIKNNIWKLLLITIVVSMLTGSAGVFTAGYNGLDSAFDNLENRIENRIDRKEDKLDDFFNRFGIIDDNDYNGNNEQNGSEAFDPDHFNDFTGKINIVPTSVFEPVETISRFTGNISIVSWIMCPLGIVIWGVYLSLIRGKCMEIGESFSYVFSNTFDKNYFKKFATVVIITIFTILLGLLFIIPGVIYAYKVRFAPQIMMDHPELSPTEAINLSKRMTADHKGELFVLDLSFIPWILLMVVTLGIAGIYFIPYRYTVDALYYENFRLRCEQEGRILPQDYVSAKEMAQQPVNNNPQQPYQTYYNPAQQQQQQSNPVYYQPQQTDYQGYYQPAPSQENTYYQPTAPASSETDYYNSQVASADDSTDESFGSNMDNNYWNNSNF